METDPNPYASPKVPTNEARTTTELEFRPNAGAFLVAIPSLLFCIAVATLALTGIETADRYYQRIGYRLLISATSAVGAYGCATVLWAKIEIKEREIIKHDFSRQVIPFSELESWHHQPFPDSIIVKLRGKRTLNSVNQLGDVAAKEFGNRQSAD